MPPFNKYHYKPLSADDTIRLIVLNSTKNIETPPTCSIIQHQRSELQAIDVEYNAISYAWGEQEFSHTLEIESPHDLSYLRIASHVDTMLRNLRTRDGKPRYMWIDAICLNQGHETEKAHQIRNMGLIYSEAKEVDIWLGIRDRAMTLQVFKFFKEAGQIREPKPFEVPDTMIQLINKHILCDNPSGNFDAPGIVEIASFFMSPWFARRWVIQEACLARQAIVHCGESPIPLTVLRQAAVRLIRLGVSSYDMNTTASLARRTVKLDILEGLWKFHKALYLEPRDRIASLLGLVSNGEGYQIDYSSPWTEIYHSTASFYLARGGNNVRLQILLHLFEFGPIAMSRGSSPPSWVPDWSEVESGSCPIIQTGETLIAWRNSLSHLVIRQLPP